jgi:probable rRNA maturation factor
MIEINNKTRSNINIFLVKKVTEKFLDYYKLNKRVSIAFVGDVIIRKLNKNYRQKDKVTDILSFDGEGDDLGEIVIDYAQIKRQSQKYSKSIQDELIFILVHGLLHLIGYDDQTEKTRKIIIKKGEDFIKKFL